MMLMLLFLVTLTALAAVRVGSTSASQPGVSASRPSPSSKRPLPREDTRLSSDRGKPHDTTSPSTSTSSSSVHSAIPTDPTQPRYEVTSTYRWALVLRALYLIAIALPLVLTAPLAYLSPLFCRTIWFPLLKIVLSHSGAAFIKWGQWASARTDMFPEALCTQLASLQSSAPKHAFYHTKNAIEKEFARPIVTDRNNGKEGKLKRNTRHVIALTTTALSVNDYARRSF